MGERPVVRVFRWETVPGRADLLVKYESTDVNRAVFGVGSSRHEWHSSMKNCSCREIGLGVRGEQGMFVKELVSSVIQVLVFAAIPFIVYVIGIKSAKGFLKDIGFYRPEGKTVQLALVASIVLFLVLWGVFLAAGAVEMFHDEASVTGMLRAVGLSTDTVLALIVMAWIKTSLSEELFFRGFLGKRLIRRYGFQAGNLLQAGIFGAVHGILIALAAASHVSGHRIALLVITSFAAGYIIGWIKEKRGNGSIIPGWIAHGLGNTVGYFVIAFVM